MSVAAGLGPVGVVNALKFTTPQQVMLKVRFVEATRTAARNLGVRWEFFKQSGNLAGDWRYNANAVFYGVPALGGMRDSQGAGWGGQRSRPSALARKPLPVNRQNSFDERI